MATKSGDISRIVGDKRYTLQHEFDPENGITRCRVWVAFRKTPEQKIEVAFGETKLHKGERWSRDGGRYYATKYALDPVQVQQGRQVMRKGLDREVTSRLWQAYFKHYPHPDVEHKF